MATPPVPPRPFDDYDHPNPPPSPPAIPPLPPGFNQYSSGPHFDDPLAAPRPHKLQPDLPRTMAQSLEDQAAQQPPSLPTAFPQPSINAPYFSPTPQGSPRGHSSLLPRIGSPLPLPQGSDWSSSAPTPTMPPSFPQPSLSPSFNSLSLGPSRSPRPPIPAPAPSRDGPPSLTLHLPTVAILAVHQSAIQQPSADPARRIKWCRDVLSLVDRAQQQHARASPTSTDPPLGPVHIDDADLQKLADAAIPIILEIASNRAPDPIPPYVAEAVYMRAMCASTGTFPAFIRHDPRNAFRDFERAAKAGHHAAWFKLGREYENFGDVQHARDCFERGKAFGVESCVYRLGMARLMGQLDFPPDPQGALPDLARAATLATVEVPQPAYVYGLLLLNEFSQVSIPPELLKPPPGTTPQEEARLHLERAAYLNFAPAQYKLGHAYEFATPPFPFDALLSVQYYSLASQQGEIEADMALSKWFLCGAEGAFDKDEGLAWTFAEKAARKGLPSAEFALGYYAEVGVGGQPDIDTARKWYMRAAQHGNVDASERLQALSQPTPQALSREQHENLTDTNLVRKRTQAKQRSEAVVGAGPSPVPAGERSKIVSNIRKNSLMSGRPPPTAYGAAAGYGSGALTGSPPSSAAPLPRVDEYASGSYSGPPGPSPPTQGTGPRPRHSSPRPQGPDGAQRPRPPLQHQAYSAGGRPASTRPAGTPPSRRTRPDAHSAQSQPVSPQHMQGQKLTFGDLGVVTTTLDEEKKCIIM